MAEVGRHPRIQLMTYSEVESIGGYVGNFSIKVRKKARYIDEDLCIGCAKCVAGCDAFGNGSLQLQVSHDICVNCNECSIARHCPAEAFSRVPSGSPNIFKGFSGGDKNSVESFDK